MGVQKFEVPRRIFQAYMKSIYTYLPHTMVISSSTRYEVRIEHEDIVLYRSIAV